MESTVTPMLKQYREIKSRHQDSILFFRLGDFYEMFFDDALAASSILDLVLTSRGQDKSGKIPMCGVPYHAADNYIAKLIKAGKNVAICEQVEDPALAKGIVKRDVIRVISAGTYLDDNTDARYLLALNPNGKASGFAFTDTVSGTIFANELTSPQKTLELISKLPIYECLCPESKQDEIKSFLNHPILKTKNISLTPFADWNFNAELAKKSLCAHLGTHNLRGFGLEERPLAQACGGALLAYLKEMNKQPLKHLNRLSVFSDDDYVHISPAAHYGLELETLLKTLDQTLTPMGRRKFRFWVYHPLKNLNAIHERQEAVAALKNILPKVSEPLKNLPDLEKALSRISCGCWSVKDLLMIRQVLTRVPLIKQSLRSAGGCRNGDPADICSVTDLSALRELLTTVINPDVPLAKPEGKIICPGYSAPLDELRSIQDNGRQWLKNYQSEEIQRTGINSLKVGYNNVFGFYIEITKTHQKSAPAHYIRKQTLVNGERYITPELKEYEENFLTAEEKILGLEKEILKGIERAILDESSGLNTLSEQIATLDCLCSLAQAAQWPNYVQPTMDTGKAITIKDGRHPVVEQSTVENFIPNDTELNSDTCHLVILTGPNMAGKSTYIRQTAILVMMAQMGGFIPATSARIGLVDKIFTRIGAHDEIAKGQSTFMVEMTEAADILNNCTARSLIILDEIGRGTSTYDGLALAWALAEHIQSLKVRTLFATHFHELTSLAEKFAGVKNYNVAVKEWKDKIIFLHKIIPGGADDSYGIYVAKLAGIPESVIQRSKKILSELELSNRQQTKAQKDQLNLFAAQIADPAMDEVRSIIDAVDPNNVTPIQALQVLEKLKKLL